MEEDAALNDEFRQSWILLLSELNSVPLFAEAGLPAHPGLLPEILRRVSSRVLPTARADSDAGLLFTSIFSSSQAVERFTTLEPDLSLRFVKLLWPAQGFQSALRVQHDLRQSLRLLATRVAGRGVTVAIRERGTTQDVHDSPFYRLIFATEMFVVKTKTGPYDRGERMAQLKLLWQETIHRCRTGTRPCPSADGRRRRQFGAGL
jgi:site-specific recombinase